MFDNLGIIIKAENINASPIAVTWPLLIAVQDDVITLRDYMFRMDALARIFFRHPLKILTESLLAISDCGFMLNVKIAKLFLDSVG
jgi:hypothetical protein